MSTPMSADAALARLRQYEERPAPTWSTASYGGGATENALAAIGRTLADEVERLRSEVESLNRSIDDQLETIQEAALALAERGDELRSLRAELAARPTRAEVLREAADFVRDAHFTDDMSVQEIGTALVHMADAAEQGEQEPGAPTPLRWGLDDAELGDDGSVTLWLSGPSGEPYVLELEPERAAALRNLLADTGGCECETGGA